MDKGRFNKSRRRRNLNPTEKCNLLWSHYKKWLKEDRETRGLWIDYRRLVRLPDEGSR
tara:strand:- start:309 stop:482 length:174 start_codon:yes stop_codon:yes gene_type:complete